MSHDTDKPTRDISAREALIAIREHADFDDGEGNRDESVLRGRLASIRDVLNGALAAALPEGEAGVLEGYVPVPMEPTEEMLRAGWNAYLDDMAGGLNRFAITYRAMLSARPAAKVKP